MATILIKTKNSVNILDIFDCTLDSYALFYNWHWILKNGLLPQIVTQALNNTAINKSIEF